MCSGFGGVWSELRAGWKWERQASQYLRIASGLKSHLGIETQLEIKWHHYEAARNLVRASLVAQRVKNLPVRWETQVQSLGCEGPLEKGLATHSSVLGASLVAPTVKNLPAMWETRAWFLGWKKGMATPLLLISSTLVHCE